MFSCFICLRTLAFNIKTTFTAESCRTSPGRAAMPPTAPTLEYNLVKENSKIL